jgi:phenylpyruvate tautomerase PptA (4-oxalocrotonate tautomerase family)
VLRPGERLEPGLAQALASRAREALAAPAGTTWVKVHALAAEQYAEDGGVPEGVYPVFASVLKAQWVAPEARQQEVDRLTQAVAEACGRPVENVHVFYQPEGAGRVAFGGRLVPESG